MDNILGSKNVHGGAIAYLMDKYGIEDFSEYLDFSVNINPLGYPDWLRPFIISQLGNLKHYPDITYRKYRKKIVSFLQRTCASTTTCFDERIILTNGASEFFYTLPQVFSPEVVIIPTPSFSCYREAWDCHRAYRGKKIQVVSFPLEIVGPRFVLNTQKLLDLLTITTKNLHGGNSGNSGKDENGGKSMIILGHPNNPTATTLDFLQISALIRDFPQTIFVIDEAFIDFTAMATSFVTLLSPNLIVSRSLTKVLAVPGLRIAYAIASVEIAKKFDQYLPPWNINELANSVAVAALDDVSYFNKTKKVTNELRSSFLSSLSELSKRSNYAFKVFDSDANFVLLQFLQFTATEVFECLLLKYKILIRNADNFFSEDTSARLGYIRLAIKDEESNCKLLEALGGIFHLPAVGSPCRMRTHTHTHSRRPTRALMIQGTSSNAGKSLLATALCRIFYQDGVKVAPFKAQNMSLNSFVTPFNEEIGRAQAVQAQAASVTMDYRMNPVLLKPNSSTVSQVILKGKPLGHMSFSEYIKIKPQIFTEVKAAYDSLSSEYDLIVLEGAGSISEVNLKKDDIVKMRMAQHASAKVLLVSDIDRGGVFGSLIGTINTLEEWERRLLGGMIINQFRGIRDLLNEGKEYLEQMTELPLLGVVPFIPNLHIPIEDSLGLSGYFKDSKDEKDEKDKKDKDVVIAVIRTPFISNFTDIDPFCLEPDIKIKFIQSWDQLGPHGSDRPDAILLLGSKSVISDLQFLQESGMAEQIKKYAREGTMVVGICGGYQILGTTIEDPYSTESNVRQINGLGLLPLITVMQKEKNLGQVRALVRTSGHSVHGYEIHHGESTLCCDREEVEAEVFIEAFAREED
ncbi:MAG: cobyric acid synthase, partial [Oligoflexia bacterium]|nr:cobyric acid synthase [Oligoflexia bacterium]